VRAAQATGFTLLELLIVIALFAVMMTVVGVGLARNLDGAKTRAISRDFVAALRHTRSLAILKQKEMSLEVDVGKKSYLVPGKTEVELPEGVDIKLLTAEEELIGDQRGRIRFYPDGASTGGRVTIVADDQEWKVNVGWLTGEVKMEEVKR
jgi:general secretion pathway protein H